MHFDAISRIVADNDLMARLYAFANIGELLITLVLFAITTLTQRMSSDIYRTLVDLHFNRLTEREADEALFGRSRKQQWLEYAEIACFILLMLSQVFTTWYILQP